MATGTPLRPRIPPDHTGWEPARRPSTPTLKELLDQTTAMHRHLCPRQVLGVRMGLYAGELLRLTLPQSDKRLQAQLLGYQRMPAADLLIAEEVFLTFSLERLLSKAGRRVSCQVCGEEILSEREVEWHGLTVCRSCVAPSYYRLAGELVPARAASDASPDDTNSIFRFVTASLTREGVQRGVRRREVILARTLSIG